MALEEINKDAISFKRLNGKAHTQRDFAISNEFRTSNIQIALTTVFGETPNPLPLSDAGLSSLGSTDGIVQKVRFPIDIIPDTQINPGQSQGYQLKLPSDYNTVTYSGGTDFAPGTYLWEALGKLQIVPALYGTVNLGTTEYDPKLYDTNDVEITKFDPIDWLLDTYSGVLFVQDPPPNYDFSAGRPAYIEAYLYVGEYLDTAITGASATALSAGRGISNTEFDNDVVSVDLQNYIAPDNILMTITGSGNTFIMRDLSVDVNGAPLPRGIQYAANYAPTFVNRSLVDKQYVDSIASGLSIKESVRVASTGNVNIGAVSTIDGIGLVDGDRVLLKDQTDSRQNGIYIYNSGTTSLTRSPDFDSSSEITSGAFTAVLTGNTNGGFIYAVSSPDPITLNTSNIIWTRLALPLLYFDGAGIKISGNTINVDGISIAGIGLTWDGAFNIAISGTNVGVGSDVFKEITTEGESETYNFRRITGSGSTSVFTSGDSVVVFSSGGSGSDFIGVPDDQTYTDGLFSSWTASTKISNAFDDVNEFLLSLAPPFAPVLDKIETTNDNAFVTGNLSFGSSNNDLNFRTVGSLGSLSPVDINQTFTKDTALNAVRRGIINIGVVGALNNDVDDDGIQNDGIPYEDGAFKYGNQGSVVLEVNDVILSSIDLTSNTNPIITTYIQVSEIKFSKFSTGAEFGQAPYRTGNFEVPASDMANGWNYARIIHSGTTEGDIETNYQEWVFDPDTNNILASNELIDNIVLTGSKFISGINYNTGGSVDYNVTIANAYRNVYSDLSTAIQFPNKNNLSSVPLDGFEMDISGSGIVNETNKVTFDLPILDDTATDPALQSFTIDATMPIKSPTNRVLGQIGDLGSVRSQVSIAHPFSSQALSNAAEDDAVGFLVYNINDGSTTNNETFTGEQYRIPSQDYTTFDYNDANTVASYDSTANLIGTDGMLVFDGSLLYPSSAILGNEYGITDGNFTLLNNAPTNPDYSGINGNKTYFRKFIASSPVTLGSLTFTIQAQNTTYSTVGSLNNPSPSGNQIVFEFYGYRPADPSNPSKILKFGYANPFASSDNPFSIENTSINGGTATCNLKAAKIVDGDIIIVRIKFASGYSGEITNVNINI